MAILTANGSKGHHKFKLTVNETNINPIENKSTISYSFELSPIQVGWDWAYWGDRISYTIVVGSKTINGTIPNYDGASNVTLQSGSFDELHEIDGKKTINISFSVNDTTGANYTCGNASQSGILKLTDLHEPPVINSVSITERRTGIPDDVFVNFLSQKTFDFDVSLSDNSPIDEYSVLGVKSSAEPFNIDIGDLGNETSVVLNYSVKDEMNGVATKVETKTLIPYFKPSFTNTDVVVKRDGQVSGKVKINIRNGRFYNSNIGTLEQVAKPKIYFKYWKKNDTEPTTYNKQISQENINVDGNTFSVSNYQLGTDFLFDQSFYVKIYVEDAFFQSEVLTKTVPLGEATWTEYKDRVDFIKATIKGKEVATMDDALDIYSTEEIVIGTWINGKPIYRKVTILPNNFSNGDNNFNTGISDMETLVNSELRFKNSGNWFSEWNAGIRNRVYMNNGSTFYMSTEALSTEESILITEYTKTTD